MKPNKLGIEIKFCLDEDTLQLQDNLRKQKKPKNNDDKNDENEKEKNENVNDEKKVKKGSLFQNIKKENKMNQLYTINEREEEKDEINSNINIVEGSKNKNNDGGLVYYLIDDNEEENKNKDLINTDDYNIPTRSKTKLPKIYKEDDYLLEKISFIEDYKNENNYNLANQLRYSVNNFNNKVYFYPKLHLQLKNNINLSNKNSRKFSKNKDNKENKLPIPYLSAINLMKSIKKYKTPFEKILLIAAISDQIMESATSFWTDMEPYIEKDYLFIEADEITSIFLYIIIQSQMPEILLYCKIINNFTTQFTKAFNIAYNYTLLEASVDYIKELKDINELYEQENGFIEASRNIMNISNQRISRLSLGMGQG